MEECDRRQQHAELYKCMENGAHRPRLMSGDLSLIRLVDPYGDKNIVLVTR